MKNLKISLIALSMVFSFCALAQTASVKDIPTEGDTTISISKGKPGVIGAEYQITEGTAQITGDPEIMVKAARAGWKKACDEWKKETKDLNKENQVLALTCNSPSCAKNETSETVCSSTGTYKVKTKIK